MTFDRTGDIQADEATLRQKGTKGQEKARGAGQALRRLRYPAVHYPAAVLRYYAGSQIPLKIQSTKFTIAYGSA